MSAKNDFSVNPPSLRRQCNLALETKRWKSGWAHCSSSVFDVVYLLECYVIGRTAVDMIHRD
jgi:hypothetical protein